MHKFILGENPMSPQSGGLWVIHLPNPKAIIELVLDGEKIHSKQAVYVKNYNYINSDGVVERWQLRLYFYFTNLMSDDAENEKLAITMLDNAFQWYKSYLIWEDENIDSGKYG